MSIYASLCKCGSVVAFVHTTAGQNEIDYVINRSRSAGRLIIETTIEDVIDKCHECACGKQPTRQLPLFAPERT